MVKKNIDEVATVRQEISSIKQKQKSFESAVMDELKLIRTKLEKPLNGDTVAILVEQGERFIFPEVKEEHKKCEKVLLQSIGHKCKLRDFIREVENRIPKTEIYRRVPKGVKNAQWIYFVDLTLSEEASEKRKLYMKKQTGLHICGSNSFVGKRKEMEKVKGGPVGDLENYHATHQKENVQINASSALILEKCGCLVEQRRASSEVDEIELESEVIREVRGLEHPVPVRGQGLNQPFFGTKRHATSNDIRRLETEVEILRKHDAEREAELVAGGLSKTSWRMS